MIDFKISELRRRRQTGNTLSLRTEQSQNCGERHWTGNITFTPSPSPCRPPF
jgi:hypothetical protein